MGRKNKNNRTDLFQESATKNNVVYRHYLNRLIELSLSMFEWKNLPDTVDPRYLELMLFENGSCLFFKDDVLGYLTLASANTGMFDVYRIPTQRFAIANNGYNAQLDNTNSVIIYNNLLHTNSVMDCEMFASDLWDIQRSLIINAKAQKTPALIKCAETERLSAINIYKEYDGNSPVILGTKGVDNIGFQVLKTDAPFVANDLYTLKTQIWNEALTFLGISNINVTKKERMITDEVIRNQGGVIASRYSRLEARRQACKQINDMFGLNIDCDYREDVRQLDMEEDELTVVNKDETGDEGGTSIDE